MMFQKIPIHSTLSPGSFIFKSPSGPPYPSIGDHIRQSGSLSALTIFNLSFEPCALVEEPLFCDASTLTIDGDVIYQLVSSSSIKSEQSSLAQPVARSAVIRSRKHTGRLVVRAHCEEFHLERDRASFPFAFCVVDNISTRGNDLELLTIAPGMSLLCLIVAIKLLVVDEKCLCESAARWSASNVNNKRTLQIN